MSDFQPPKTLGACADLLYKLQQQKSKLNREIEAIEKDESALREHFIKNVAKDDATGVSGKTCKVRVVTKDKPTVKDWDKFYAHILKTKNFAFLQRRVSESAVAERWDAGKDVPGVDVFTVKTLSVTKL